jgi:hypothetical protein
VFLSGFYLIKENHPASWCFPDGEFRHDAPGTNLCVQKIQLVLSGTPTHFPDELFWQDLPPPAMR